MSEGWEKKYSFQKPGIASGWEPVAEGREGVNRVRVTLFGLSLSLFIYVLSVNVYIDENEVVENV